MGRPPGWRATAEAADQQIGKRSKIDTAYQAMMTGHFKELARQEEVAVAEYRKGKTGVDVGKSSTAGNNDLIVCDNMTIDNGKGGGLGTALLGAAIAGGALWYFGLLDSPDVPSPVVPAVPAAAGTDTDTQYSVVPTEGR